MPVYITSLNSGSNGNCYYIGNEHEAVLIDAGISCRETEKRMKKLGLVMEKVKAIFVSHEHSDHITGIPGISKKYQLPVYITNATLASSGIPIEKHLVHSFTAHTSIAIGNLSITPFPKFHDASDPHSFIISGDAVNIGVFTDIGSPCKHVIKYFKQCNAAFLEANYCEDMLEKGNYPVHLKRRISSDNGHLSNMQALDLFLRHKGKNLSHLILSHLSKNNNSMSLVESIFSEHSGNVEITVASRYKETPVFCIEDLNGTSSRKKANVNTHTQLTLF
ncbi:MAG: MBL fold metallo-hydrolase [Bacteroidetes bacterium]|nr:MBL fold metallo-hydrolase [Bacteroidota bacterium]